MGIRQQKIGFFGQFTPTGVDPTAGDKLRALAGLSNQLGDIATQFGIKNKRERELLAAKTQQKKGLIEGAATQRDSEGNLIIPDLKEGFSVESEAFNRAAILANRAQIQIDTRAKLDDLQEQHKLDPEAFLKTAGEFRKGTLSGMTEELANLVAQDIDASSSSRFSTLRKEFFKRESAANNATILEGLETGVDAILNATRSGDLDEQQRLIIEQNAALNEGVLAGAITPNKAEALKEDLRERITEQTALGEVDRIIFDENLSLEERVAKGVDFLDSLRKSKELKDLSPEQKDSLVNIVGAKVGGLQVQLKQQQSQKTIEQTRLISNLKIDAKLGFSSPEDIIERTEKAFNEGLLSGAERTSIFTDVFKGQKKKSDIATDDALIARKLSGDDSLVIEQKKVDDYYDRNVRDQLAELPPNIKVAEQALFIDRMKAVPKLVKQEVFNNILSGDPELIKQAVDLVDRVDEMPGIVDQLVSPSQRAFIESVVTLSANMEPEQAIALSRELTDPRDKARIEAREDEIESEKMRASYPDVVENAFESFFGRDFLTDNVNKESVNREYEQLFESFFKAGMNKDRAEEKAIDILKTNWKESQFGFMKHPPEDFYRVGNNVDYIKDQLAKDVTKDFTGFKFKKDNLFLLSDEQTARKASQGQPDYRVMVIDNNGEIQVLQGRWKPDMQAEADKQTKENEKLFKEGRTRIETGLEERIKQLESEEFGRRF